MKNFYWLGYSVFVVILAGVSLWAIFGSGRKQWEEVLVSQKKADVQQGQAQLLRVKIGKVQALSQQKLEEDLRLLVSGVPTARQMLPLISELKMAAALSGSEVDGYSARVGEVLEASASAEQEDAKWDMELGLVVADVAQLHDFLNKLELMLPVVEVVRVDYISGRAKIIVSQRFGPLVRLATDPYLPVPEIEPRLSTVKETLSRYASPGSEF